MYIGIDLGTSSVKLILTSPKGEILNVVSREYPLLIPKPLWTEQDPNAWYDQTIDGLKEVVKGYEKDIKGMSFSGQMHGLVLLDKNDVVLRNALLWNDQRTVTEVEYLNNQIGIENLLKHTGNIALTGLTAPKLLWVRNNEPELFQQIDKIMLPKDYLAYKLSGNFASDVSDLSGTLYFDVENRKYSQEMLNILKISENQLPEVFESYDVIGTLLPTIKQELGIAHDVKIIIGGGDQAVGAVGVGIVGDGECSISLGTSGVVFVSSEKFKIDHKSYLQSYSHSNGKYHLMGVMLNAAGALKWWSESIFENYNYDEFFAKLSETEMDDDLYFLPYLSGERSPINDPNARGVFFGLRLEHRKVHMDRAVIEGVTYALRDSFELIRDLGVPISTVRLTGGGAKSQIWAQMIADIMNVNVVTIAVEEGPALGASILAMVGCKEYQTVEDACKSIVEINKTYTPNKVKHAIYNKKYNFFKNIYPSLKKLLV